VPRSDRARTPPEDPPIRVRSLFVLVSSIPCLVPAFQARGVLLDGTRPLVGARVGLVGARLVTTTDSAGAFVFDSGATIPSRPAPQPPRWRRRGAFLEVRAEEPILAARLAGPDGRILSVAAPAGASTRLRLPSASHGPVVLEVRTGSGTWARQAVSFSGAAGSFAAARDQATRDTLCIVASGRPVLKVPVLDSSTDLRIAVPAGRWTSGDFHTHTVLTDGSRTMPDVLAHALGGTWDLLDADGDKTGDSTVTGFGLDWIANSEHGGSFCRDPRGRPWSAAVAATAKGAPPSGCLWRWQALLEWSWPLLDSLRRVHPGKTLIQGLEWNVPAHDHASVGILARSPVPIATFEYLFDGSDLDSAGGLAVLAPGTPKDPVNSHAKAVAGLAWLQRNHRDSSYVVINHPSRILRVGASDLRDFLDAAPDVFLGIEAMPGHPKAPFRGLYGISAGTSDSLPARTLGGADFLLARLGGAADALWSEGRPLRIFANSDFHLWSDDFDAYPGEYARNTNLARDTGAAALLESLRQGSGYCQTGGLVAGLDFLVDDGVSATRMGGWFRRSSVTDSVNLVVRWKPAVRNPRGDLPRLDHIDIVAGPIHAPDPSADRARSSVEGVSVVRRLEASDFTARDDGWREATVRLRPDGPTFYRLRGTNLAPSTPDETDAQGNPLADTEGGPNTAARAWNDLWVYTNPIFLGL